MTLQVLEAQTGENPVATILIMHGLGADGRDFIPIAEQLDLSIRGLAGPACRCGGLRSSLPITLHVHLQDRGVVTSLSTAATVMAASTNTSPHCENGVLAVTARLLRS